MSAPEEAPFLSPPPRPRRPARPAICALGFHSWYVDGAWFTYGLRCLRCEAWKDPIAGSAVERERRWWAKHPPEGKDLILLWEDGP